MRTVTLLLIAAAAVAITGAPGYAQKAKGPAAPKPGAAAQLAPRAAAFQRALAQLSLTDAQKSRIRAIEADLKAKLQALRADATLTPAQKRDKAAVYSREARQAILAVLTPQQRERLAQIMRRQGAARADFWAMVARLELTAEQKAQIRTIRAGVEERLKAIRQSDAAPERKRAQARQVMAAARERVLALLTDAQRRQLREWLADRPVRPRAAAPGKT